VLLLFVHCGGSTAVQTTPADAGSTADAPGDVIHRGVERDARVGDDDSARPPVTGDDGSACPLLTLASEGAACELEGVTCPAPDVFCEAGGYGRLECENGRWVEPLGCWEGGVADGGSSHIVDGGSFACGDTTCAAGDYCADHPPGIPSLDGGRIPDAYVCMPVPPSCASSPTCGCIESTIPAYDPCSPGNVGGNCTADGAGNVTIYCLGV
jgi:hypothetical protein